MKQNSPQINFRFEDSNQKSILIKSRQISYNLSITNKDSSYKKQIYQDFPVLKLKNRGKISFNSSNKQNFNKLKESQLFFEKFNKMYKVQMKKSLSPLKSENKITEKSLIINFQEGSKPINKKQKLSSFSLQKLNIKTKQIKICQNQNLNKNLPKQMFKICEQTINKQNLLNKKNLNLLLNIAKIKTIQHKTMQNNQYHQKNKPRLFKITNKPKYILNAINKKQSLISQISQHWKPKHGQHIRTKQSQNASKQENLLKIIKKAQFYNNHLYSRYNKLSVINIIKNN